MSASCQTPIELSELSEYRAGELGEAREVAIEEHYFSCAECTARLAWLDSLSDAVRRAVREGEVSSNVSSSFIDGAAALGVRLRTYEIAPGGTVHCTIAPEEDFVVVRLQIDEATKGDFDVEVVMTDLESGSQRNRSLKEVSVDRESGQLVYAFSGPIVRTFPRSLWKIHLRPHGEARELGTYTMDHTPWDQLSAPR